MFRLIIALAISSSCCTYVSGGPTENPNEYIISGVVKSIDVKTNEVTILRDNGKETTVKIIELKDRKQGEQFTEVILDQKNSTFDKIKLKQEVCCRFLLDTKLAVWFGMYEVTNRPRE